MFSPSPPQELMCDQSNYLTFRSVDSSGVGMFPMSQSFTGVEAIAYAIKGTPPSMKTNFQTGTVEERRGEREVIS